MAVKLKRWKPTLGHNFMRTDAVMVASPKGGYVDYEEAQKVITRLQKKLAKYEPQQGQPMEIREQVHG